MFQATTLATYVTFAITMPTKTNSLGLNSNVLYESLSALELVTSPMMVVLQLVPSLQASATSSERIQRFLNGEVIENAEENYSFFSVGSADVELSSWKIKPQTAEQHSDSLATFLQNAALAIDDSKPLLHGLNLQFSPGSLTTVCGKVGSGKSVLFRALIGEATLLCGAFNHSASGTAFCDLTAWLRNASVRGNIIREEELEECGTTVSYRAVVSYKISQV